MTSGDLRRRFPGIPSEVPHPSATYGMMPGFDKTEHDAVAWAKQIQWRANLPEEWKDNPTWGIERVAKKIQKMFPNETVRTIRLRIKKPSL